MTVHADERYRANIPEMGSASYEKEHPVDVAPGVPTDRVRWGPILAGTFAALTMLAVLSAFGAAVGLSAYDRGDDARRFAFGAGIWGAITTLIAFGFGGWLAARSAAVRGSDAGLLNGFMVAGVGVPLLFGALGGATMLMGHAAVSSDRNVSPARRTDSARQASAVLPGDNADSQSNASRNNSNDTDDTARIEDAQRAGRGAAWGTLVALLLAIGAASAGGYMGARDDHYATRRERVVGSSLGVPV